MSASFTATGEVQVKCLICDGAASCEKTTAISSTTDGKVKFMVYNHIKHIAVHGVSFLTAKDAEAARKERGDSNKRPKPSDAEARLVSEPDSRIALAKMIVLGGFPVNIVENEGFRFYQERHGLSMVSRRTVGRSLHDMQETLVLQPLREYLGEALRTEVIVLEGLPISFKYKMTVGVDGWDGINGQHFLSFTLSMGKNYNRGGSMMPLVEMRPRVIPAGVRAWKLGDAGQFTAAAQAQEIVNFLEALPVLPGMPKVSAADVLSYAMDTTNVNPATVRHVSLAAGGAGDSSIAAVTAKDVGPFFTPCQQHEWSSTARDLMKNTDFSASTDAVVKLTMHTMASSKRWNKLLEKQAALEPGRRAVKPIVPGPTRFMTNLITKHRMLRLLPAYKAMRQDSRNGRQAFDPSTQSEFNQLVDKVEAFEVQLREEVEMFTTLLKECPVLGRQDTYTASLPRVFLERQLRSVAGQQRVSATGIAEEFEEHAFTRLAPLSWFNTDAAPPLATPPGTSTVEFAVRVRFNDLENLAVYLDVSKAALSAEVGIDIQDALIVGMRILTRCMVFKDVAQPVAAAGTKLVAPSKNPAYKAAQDAVTSMAKGKFESDVAFAERKQAASDAVKREYGVAAPGAGRPAESSTVSIVQLETLIWDALQKESVAFRGIFLSHGSGLKAFIQTKFGDPINKTDQTALYTWWPEHKATLPLHCFLATMVLGGARATSTANEEYHSALGLIHRKHRASLSDDNLQFLSLGRAFMKEQSKEAARTRETLKEIAERADADGYVDDDDIELAAVAVGLPAPVAAEEDEQGDDHAAGGAAGGSGGAARASGGSEVMLVDD